MPDPATIPPCWYAACRSRQLKRKPLQCALMGRPFVLFRDAAGAVGAMDDRCPHRNAPLSHGTVRGGRLVCPYHGWEFDRTGQCQFVPGMPDNGSHATRFVPSFETAEQDGLVWVCSEPNQSPAGPPPRIELLTTPGYVSIVRDFILEASLTDALENFLDPMHTHFVHSGLVRSQSERRAVRAVIRRGEDWVEAEYQEEQQSGLISRLFGMGITRTLGRFVLPSTAQLEYWTRDRLKMVLTTYLTPIAPAQQRAFTFVVANPSPLPHWLVKRPFEWFLLGVLRQDQRILKLQSANLQRFGGPHYSSTEIDILRTHIVRLLEGTKRGAADNPAEKHVTLML